MRFSFILLFISLVCSSAQATIVRLRELTPTIYRGGQPETLADYEQLARMGIKTILNLRDDPSVNEEQALAEKMGFHFVNIPLNALKYPKKKDINEALDLIVNPSAQPVFFHCRHGKDRTGLIAALYRVHYENWSPKAAYLEWQSLDFNAWLMGLTSYFWLHVRP